MKYRSSEHAKDQNHSGENTKLSTNSSSSKQYVIDTCAWVEYLLGSSKGAIAKEYIEGGSAFTPSIVLVELRKWYLKEIEVGRRRETEMQKHFEFLEYRTQVLILDSSLI